MVSKSSIFIAISCVVVLLSCVGAPVRNKVKSRPIGLTEFRVCHDKCSEHLMRKYGDPTEVNQICATMCVDVIKAVIATEE